MTERETMGLGKDYQCKNGCSDHVDKSLLDPLYWEIKENHKDGTLELRPVSLFSKRFRKLPRDTQRQVKDCIWEKMLTDDPTLKEHQKKLEEAHKHKILASKRRKKKRPDKA